jgi:hypothetical protein
MQRRDHPFEALDAGAVVIIKGWRLCDRCNQAAANQEHLLIVEALQTMVTLFSTSNLLYSRRRLLVTYYNCVPVINSLISLALQPRPRPSQVTYAPAHVPAINVKSKAPLTFVPQLGLGLWLASGNIKTARKQYVHKEVGI